MYEFEENRPEVGDGTYVHPEAVLIGSVRIGRGCYIGAGAVLRADFGEIVIGNGSNVQECAVIHVSPGQRVFIEDDVVIAHSAILHDVIVKRGAVVGMGAILLHYVTVEEESIVGAGSLVSSGFTVPSRKVVIGSPARIHKDVSSSMLDVMKAGLAVYQELPARYLTNSKPYNFSPRNA
jgi:phenylacetic acid degradation protein